MAEIYIPDEDSYLLSEVLRKQIPKLLANNKNLKFLEIGCGSGIQLQTAFDSGVKKSLVFSCDINHKSVKHCKKFGFNSVVSDLFEKIKGKYDVIVFNPPYLPLDFREPEESKIATTGGLQGSEIINEFLRQSKKHLAKNGKIFLVSSSLTKGINFLGFRKEIIEKKKIFFEELKVWELY